jgi:retron-type reverse transcriptase
MQLSLFHQPVNNSLIYELFEAYFACRKNKRNTINALRFETDFETELFKLRDEIELGTYQPKRCIAFIVNKPVKREIFAADFRDRVVHHYVIGKVNALFEALFIPNSFACRKNKGTLYGIQKTAAAIRLLSNNYSEDLYVMKLDIAGFFMNINREILFEKLASFLHTHYYFNDRLQLIELFRKIIFQNPAASCIIKGHTSDWDGLPKNKSLFYSPSNCGLPIGNLTSQVLANFYLHDLDQFILSHVPDGYYGRYVDDFVMLHNNKQHLITIKTKIENYVKEKLQLNLHPNKVYLQHYSKGLPYLGTIIKPGRIYSSRRTKGNFFKVVRDYLITDNCTSLNETECFVASVNSYLGHLIHFNTYRLRMRMLKKIESSKVDKLAIVKGYLSLLTQ